MNIIVHVLVVHVQSGRRQLTPHVWSPVFLQPLFHLLSSLSHSCLRVLPWAVSVSIPAVSQNDFPRVSSCWWIVTLALCHQDCVITAMLSMLSLCVHSPPNISWTLYLRLTGDGFWEFFGNSASLGLQFYCPDLRHCSNNNLSFQLTRLLSFVLLGVFVSLFCFAV